MGRSGIETQQSPGAVPFTGDPSSRPSNATTPLQRIHPDSTYEGGSAKFDLDAIRRMPTADIVKSLAPGSTEVDPIGWTGIGVT